jgi:GDP-L-fucose synthase
MEHYEDEKPVNVGCGRDQTVAELAEMVARVVGFTGALRYDSSKPDGAPRKLLDTSRLEALGWAASTGLEAGIRATYAWFLANRSMLRA